MPATKTGDITADALEIHQGAVRAIQVAHPVDLQVRARGISVHFIKLKKYMGGHIYIQAEKIISLDEIGAKTVVATPAGEYLVEETVRQILAKTGGKNGEKTTQAIPEKRKKTPVSY